MGNIDITYLLIREKVKEKNNNIINNILWHNKDDSLYYGLLYVDCIISVLLIKNAYVKLHVS